MFLAPRWHVRSVEQIILRAGEKMPKHTMPWIYRTRTSITKSSLSRSLDHLEDPRSKEFGGSLQSSLLLRLSRSISILLTECSTQQAQPCDAANLLAVAMTSSQHVYEVRPRKDHCGVDLISDALLFGRLWYGEPNAVSNAIEYAKFYRCSHHL